MSCAVSRGNFPAWRRRSRRELRRLTPEQVARIRALGANLPALAREFKVSVVTVWKVARRKTYRDLP
jgi:DNA invertase Pin-like site-specific DNA recombinase